MYMYAYKCIYIKTIYNKQKGAQQSSVSKANLVNKGIYFFIYNIKLLCALLFLDQIKCL